MSSSHQISISDIAIIVAAKNEENNILTCIESILNSSKGQCEIIAVDDGSTDQTPAILQSFGNRIQVITTQGVGPSIARNQAMESTSKPYVAFADADSIVDQKWLEILIKEFNGKDISFVSIGGSQQMHPKAGTWDLFHASFLECMGFVSDYVHAGKSVKEVKHNPTCNVLYIKDEVVKIGGFDPDLWPCEDLDLDIRLRKAGKRFLFTPSAMVYHHRPDSIWGFMKMMCRYGFGHAQIVKKHGPCQKIHAMPVIVALSGIFIFWQATHVWLVGFIFIKYALLSVYSFLLILSKSLLRALIYGLYLVPTILFWNIGFFTGLFQKKKITKK